VLRTTGFLRRELAERVTDWFTGKPTAPSDAVRRSYRALERETARLFDIVRRAPYVFGHAALGVGFDLQSEFATWLQCRTLFSDVARLAAFCELVGAVTTYVMTGDKPALHADLPPTELVASCDVDGCSRVLKPSTI
jgi:hypothetical protein